MVAPARRRGPAHCGTGAFYEILCFSVARSTSKEHPVRWSKYHLYTTREVPADAEVISHQLMLRTGMIKKVAAGIYTYMPFGWRSLQKLMTIVRRELDASGA